MRRILLTFLAVALIAAGLAYALSYRAGLRALDAELDQSLILTRRAIESEIERFRYLPDVAAEDVRIGVALRDRTETATAAANRYLETVTARSGAADLYLLDASGTAIAASNWNTAQSFVGSNYAFRPYFTDALATGKGRFYAIGVTTGKPGYFLSTRIGGVDTPGVIVVKIDLKPLEETWKAAGVPTAIADRDGVVFLSGIADWLYRPLTPLSPEALAELAARRTYDGIALASAPPLLPAGAATTALALRGPDGGRLHGRVAAIEADGWRVISAAPLARIIAASALWAAGAALVATAATGLAMIYNQRRQLTQLRLRQGALLETRVAERTRELAHEIEARRKTEADLRAAQETLVHTEKMAALGRMSAAIVHEMSQPLAAMEATLAAAELSADAEKTTTRIGTARNLIRRMQRTTKHLKSFSRKEQNTRQITDLNKVAENALDLVAPRAKAAGVAPGFRPSDTAPLVMAGPVRLEQVCLNLLLNALDAVEGREGAAVTLATGVREGTAFLAVTDTGAGIAPEDMARVTEPFFSTKIGGEGLGLGLSISQAIVTEFGGRIDIASAPGAGTTVTVELPAVAALGEAAE
ncbi:sensor histidine kinase [Defluviimonas sp. SAOS-178_SWC]|uniref:sensor histidine kinase n=1 Tax=Defluviimonas sp. SAOS-178_SWC TaxID=3121287 RepID=UPI003221FD85